MANISDLPSEILLHIFRFYLKRENQRKLMKNIANVCLNWKRICQDSYLWTKYDGTLSLEEMTELSEMGCLNYTKELIVSSSGDLQNVNEEKLISGLKNVEVIDFSNVSQLSRNTLSVVANNCSKLRVVRIGNQNKEPTRLNYAKCGVFFAARGYRLIKINLSHCSIVNFQLIIRCIADCCPNLEQLHLTNVTCHIGIFSPKYVQIHCPKLKVLHLDSNIKISNVRHTAGFPNLEVFTYLDSKFYTFKDKDLENLVFNSPNLKFLDLTNCAVSATALYSLSACAVEYLYVSGSKMCSTIGLSDVLKKWSHSLKEVDVSFASHYDVNKAILILVTNPVQSPLEFLNLYDTKITGFMVEKILQNCMQLEVLNLESCKNLSQGMSKIYRKESEFKDLSKKLDIFKSTHPDEFGK